MELCGGDGHLVWKPAQTTQWWNNTCCWLRVSVLRTALHLQKQKPPCASFNICVTYLSVMSLSPTSEPRSTTFWCHAHTRMYVYTHTHARKHTRTHIYTSHMHTHTQLTQSAWWTSTTEICYTHCFLALFLFQSSSFCLQFVWKVVKQEEVLKQLGVTTEDACRQCLASHDLTSYCGDHELHTTASVSPALSLHLALHHKISSDHAPNQESTLLHTQSRARVRPDHKLKIKILTISQFFLGRGEGGRGYVMVF